jgi:hypothetical protein
MAVELKNFYYESVAQHYGISSLQDSALTYYHFVFPTGTCYEKGCLILINLLEKLVRPYEDIILDYHYAPFRQILKEVCQTNGYQYNCTSKILLSIILPDANAFLKVLRPLKNEDNLFLRFLHKNYTSEAIRREDRLRPDEKSYLSSMSTQRKAVAFLSLNPFDLEFITSDRIPYEIENAIKSMITAG